MHLPYLTFSGLHHETHTYISFGFMTFRFHGRYYKEFQVSLTQSLDSICSLSDFMDVNCGKVVSTPKNGLGAFQVSLTQSLDSICKISDFMDVNSGKVVNTTKDGLGAFQVSFTQSLDSICLLSDFMDVNCGKVVSSIPGFSHTKPRQHMFPFIFHGCKLWEGGQ